ncbi:MAG: hypothetical protein Q9M76_04470 [Candidatus Dojkabacteria bacterium]|nr:hypothetical protein [Candidatus Dojkabacteria bacterium]
MVENDINKRLVNVEQKIVEIKAKTEARERIQDERHAQVMKVLSRLEASLLGTNDTPGLKMQVDRLSIAYKELVDNKHRMRNWQDRLSIGAIIAGFGVLIKWIWEAVTYYASTGK